MQIEQAIFTSAKSDRASGYHLVSRSPGISEADARDLAAWGPSHDSLLGSEAWPPHAEVYSDNFFPLTSGAFCVSRTTAAGVEYSERGGAQVYTQCLVVPAEVLTRFANNPFALLRAAAAAGALVVFDHAPAQLAAIELGGRTPPVDRALLARFTSELGATAVARLVEAALANPILAVVGASTENAFAALFNCLPVDLRTQFSYSTGLKHSGRRPVRLLRMGEDRASAAQLARHHTFATFNLVEARAGNTQLPTSGWAGFVAVALSGGKLPLLTAEIGDLQRKHPLLELDSRGDTLLLQLGGAAAHTASPIGVTTANVPQVSVTPESPNVQRADAPHWRFTGQPTCAGADVAVGNTHDVATASQNLLAGKKLAAQTPAVIEMLEHLDDVVFAAIEGQAVALEQVEVVWALVLEELGPELVEESREQYLRYALQVWNQCLTGELSDPERAVAAVDVMCLLFGE